LDNIPAFERDPQGKPIIGADAQSIYAYGHLIRGAEQLILDQFGRGLLSGTTHTCLGQELCAMAVVRALDHPRDAVLSNHRNHGHFLTYSGDFTGLVAEVMGRADGVNGGHGGSQHLAYRHFHSNGVQAGMSGIGVGLALARKRSGDGGIVAALIGDGTLGEGLLYESMNLASIWRVPLLFVVENNGIAQTTYTNETIGGRIEARGEAFGLDTRRCDDADPGLFQQVEAVVSQVRDSGRPGFLIIDTRRLGPHSKGDDLRDQREMEAIRHRDPLTGWGRRLPESRRQAIEERNREFLMGVRERAEASPEARFEEPPAHIFAPSVPSSELEPPGSDASAPEPEASGPGNVRQALNRSLRELLAGSQRTLLIGEDLHDPYGGAFKVSAGLSTEFPGRVISTPISEAGITGACIGLAMAGQRPIMEVMFADFLTLCMDQIYNHAVKFPGVFPEVHVPLVIRTPSGGRRGYGPTHSQSPENLFTAVPGLTVVYPSQRHDVGRLLRDACLHWSYPVLFLEHKLLYGERCDPGEYRALEPTAEDVAAQLFPTLVRDSAGGEPDLTLLSYGGMLPETEAVAEQLQREEELEVEIVAPSLLAPLPREGLIGHLLRSPRIAIVEEAHHEFGVGAEVCAGLVERGYRGEVVRIGTPPVPIASARSLERQIIPDRQALVDRILDLF
jgi:2-oxoisovalerate dehydrogenase E1 component